MKNIPKKQKKHKFNIIDGIVLALTISVLLAVTVFVLDPLDLFKDRQAPVQEKNVSCVLEFNDLNSISIASIKNGQRVTLMTGHADTAKITKVKKVPSSEWILSENGEEMVLVENEKKETLFVTIQIKCVYKDGEGYFLNDTQLLVGNDVSVKFDSFEAVGKCIGITLDE